MSCLNWRSIRIAYYKLLYIYILLWCIVATETRLCKFYYCRINTGGVFTQKHKKSMQPYNRWVILTLHLTLFLSHTNSHVKSYIVHILCRHEMNTSSQISHKSSLPVEMTSHRSQLNCLIFVNHVYKHA